MFNPCFKQGVNHVSIYNELTISYLQNGMCLTQDLTQIFS